jgi:hypothetical protein
VPVFHRSSFSAKSFSSKSWRFDRAFVPASLGAWGPIKRIRRADEEVVEEAFPPAVVSRLRGEMLAAALMQDEIRKARRRREEAVLLLMM